MPWIEGYYTIQRIKGPTALSYNESKCIYYYYYTFFITYLFLYNNNNYYY